VVSRGEVWLAALDPTLGSEIRKTRPCLVVSPDDLNRHLRTTTVVPMTTGSRPARFRVPIAFAGKDGLLLADQIRTVDQRRLVKHLGEADRDTVAAMLSVLREMFAD
jgi:mRNA interferase MazF